ncbi:MAG: hypothetical protein ACLGGX_05900 [Bdellovibrionia bacterium]
MNWVHFLVLLLLLSPQAWGKASVCQKSDQIKEVSRQLCEATVATPECQQIAKVIERDKLDKRLLKDCTKEQEEIVGVNIGCGFLAANLGGSAVEAIAKGSSKFLSQAARNRLMLIPHVVNYSTIPIVAISTYIAIEQSFEKDRECFENLDEKKQKINFLRESNQFVLEQVRSHLTPIQIKELTLPDYLGEDSFIAQQSCAQINERIVRQKRTQDKFLGPLLASKKIAIDPRKLSPFSKEESEAITLLSQNLQCMSSQRKAEFLCVMGNSFYGANLMRNWLKGDKEPLRNPAGSTADEVVPSPQKLSQSLQTTGRVEVSIKYNNKCGGAVSCRETLVLNSDIIEHIKPHYGWSGEQKNYLKDFLHQYRDGKIQNDNEINYWLNSYSERVAKSGAVNPVSTPRPFRKDKDTSLFPDGVSADDVILSLQKNGGIRSKLIDSENVEVVRVQHRGDYYDILVCRSQCKRKNPEGTLRENEVLTIYPHCGENIKKIVSLQKAKKIVSTKDPLLSENSFLEAVPCN